ncbi:MAG: DMP19 family protein [Pseudomonadales bacterium]|jgi:hypothetical protein|nr:DMP19 family protein [Pseudomonadales bacterium]
MNDTLFDEKWDAICTACLERVKAVDYDITRLSQDEAEVVALWRLVADGYNGGFLQFFCNWGENNCAIALNALRHIGAANTLAIVQKQRNIVERLNGHPDMKEYEDVYRLLTDEEADTIYCQLDPEFWDAAKEIPILAAPIYQYLISQQIRRH